MKILLHIGVWKTGSTAIQRFVRANARTLRKHNVVAPGFTLQPGGNEALVRALRLSGDRRLNALTRAIAKDARGRDNPTILLSSEHFWPLGRAQRVRLGAALQSLSDDIQVLAYVRPQEAMWASLYAQQAKNLRVRTNSALWGDADFIGQGIARRALLYGRCFSGFRRTVSRNVTARRYARDRFTGGDVVVDFLEAAGIAMDPALDFSGEEVNASLGWKGVAFSAWCAERLAARGLLAGDRRRFRNALVAAAADMASDGDADWLGRGPNFLDAEAVAAIRSHYAADTSKLSKRFFGGADPFGPPRNRPVAPRDPAAIPAGEFAAATAAFEAHLGRAGRRVGRRLRLADGRTAT